jgi:hypothetical protein
MVQNSGFLNFSTAVKVNSFIELTGNVFSDQGYEWFWAAYETKNMTGFRIKNV